MAVTLPEWQSPRQGKRSAKRKRDALNAPLRPATQRSARHAVPLQRGRRGQQDARYKGQKQVPHRRPRAARLSPQPGGHLSPPLRTHTLQLRQGVTMYPSNSTRIARERRGSDARGPTDGPQPAPAAAFVFGNQPLFNRISQENEINVVVFSRISLCNCTQCFLYGPRKHSICFVSYAIRWLTYGTGRAPLSVLTDYKHERARSKSLDVRRVL